MVFMKDTWVPLVMASSYTNSSQSLRSSGESEFPSILAFNNILYTLDI